MPILRDGTIEARQVWKRFRADRNPGQLRDEVTRVLRRGRADPTVRERYRWALRAVDLHAEPGDSVALIGVNGSGKSTLLKILTGVMYPHAGSVLTSGRVGSLIEVVSGIHHELTGRENLYLYGALMGLPRSRIATIFDELIGSPA